MWNIKNYSNYRFEIFVRTGKYEDQIFYNLIMKKY